MENLNLLSTETTPWVNFDVTEGILEIGGKSYAADLLVFYKPVVEWIDLYVNRSVAQHTVLNIKLEQFNDDTTKILLQIFQKINRLLHYEINWFYEDSHILELGEDLSFMVGANFNFIKVN